MPKFGKNDPGDRIYNRNRQNRGGERRRTKHRYLSWALETGRKRIEQIVSNKHRGAYDRAAETLGALAERYLLNGEEEKSRSLIDEYRNQRYNRYPAFRRELDSLIAVSGPLHWKTAGRA